VLSGTINLTKPTICLCVEVDLCVVCHVCGLLLLCVVCQCVEVDLCVVCHVCGLLLLCVWSGGV